MQSKNLEFYLAKRTTRSASFLDQIGRSLRKEGMLPSGSRGRNAPSLQANHVANFLIATAMASTAGDAPSVVATYSGLVESGTDIHFPGQKPGQKLLNFGEVLSSIFSNEEALELVVSVEFQRWPKHPDFVYSTSVDIEWVRDEEWRLATFLPSGAHFPGRRKEAIHVEMQERVAVEKFFVGGEFLRGIRSHMDYSES